MSGFRGELDAGMIFALRHAGCVAAAAVDGGDTRDSAGLS